MTGVRSVAPGGRVGEETVLEKEDGFGRFWVFGRFWEAGTVLDGFGGREGFGFGRGRGPMKGGPKGRGAGGAAGRGAVGLGGGSGECLEGYCLGKISLSYGSSCRNGSGEGGDFRLRVGGRDLGPRAGRRRMLHVVGGVGIWMAGGDDDGGGTDTEGRELIFWKGRLRRPRRVVERGKHLGGFGGRAEVTGEKRAAWGGDEDVKGFGDRAAGVDRVRGWVKRGH